LSPIREATPAPSPAQSAQLPASGAASLTTQDVNAWLDGLMPYAIGKGDIPGAVVVVVKDGQILASRGYGYANLAKRTRVDPARTLFRPGSVSKLFTWTAVMQQVEQGKLNLDGDVNRYLDFKIPAFEGKPVTLANIMTHTAGFEEQAKDIITTKSENYIKFDTLLKRWVPRRVFAPGTTPAYSNYATSLAAYMVQRVSGEPFDTYIERHIFTPLGMAHSTFRQPLPANLRPLMSEGYISGKDKPYGYEFIGPAPAGSLAASGEDMGRFMIAHLQDGGGKILRPQTAQLMHRRRSQPIPGGQGMALGFYQADINGTRVIAHGGDTVAFHSDLHLFLDKGVGLFVSFNSSGKDGAAGPLRSALLDEFADRYFPAPADTRKLDVAAAKAGAQQLAGLYSVSRRSFSNFLGITDLIGQTKVSVGEDGSVLIPDVTGLGGQPRKWIATGPGTWRDASGHETLGAVIEEGHAVRMSPGAYAPIMVFDRVPWHRSSAWLLPLLYLSLGVLTLTALLWPTRALVRRRFGASLPLEKRSLQAFRASRIGALAIVLVLVGWLTTITVMFSDTSNLNSGYDLLLYLLQALSFVAFVGGFAAMLWWAYTVWSGSGARWTTKLWSVLLVIAAATVLYIALIYKLIGWTVNY
jgi:CubicO group peptidase (beta-lactamase class C family)